MDLFTCIFKSVRQLSSSDRNKSFMGSDFTYSDIAGRKLNQDHHKLVKESDSHYFIESKPKDAKRLFTVESFMLFIKNIMLFLRLFFMIVKGYD